MSAGATFGFSALPPRVAEALECVYGHHRTPWFEGVLARIGDLLEPALRGRYTPLFLTCTASGGREAVVANLVRASDRVLTTGPAFEHLARIWGAHVDRVSGPGELASTSPDAGLLEHVLEDGSLVDVRAVTAEIRRVAPDTPIVLDATFSFGSDFWDAETFEVDALMITPERALMGIPGLTILAVRERFVEILKARRADLAEAPFLYDILRYHRLASKHTTPYSPNISACVALEAALKLIESAGGLSQHQKLHEHRARSIRQRLAAFGMKHGCGRWPVTHAFTSCELPGHVDKDAAIDLLRKSDISVRVLDSAPPILQIAHVGFVPEPQLERLFAAVDRSFGCGAVAATDAASTSPRAPATSVTPPFTIAADEFRAQAGHHARRMLASDAARASIIRAARRVFRSQHLVHEEALRHRRIGFVGAGRIARRAVALCRRAGIRHITVYSPALARTSADGPLTREQRQRQTEWQDEPVDIALTLDELFTTAHAIVLLPVLYDELALRLFRKGPEYRNEGLVSADLLARAERAGRLDIIINAAARPALVDRSALTCAVQHGWLRYYSDEMPHAHDPLLDCDGARFTGHVGGSCKAPQAAVARNTHRILRHTIAQLIHMAVADDDEQPPLSVVNAHLLGANAHARLAAARPASTAGPIRVLLTDPFDLESLAFDRLHELGTEIEVHDAAAEDLSPAALADRIRTLRPHILMLRSRTVIDDAVAARAVEQPELAFVIRPGVGVDNLYGGLERLSGHGVQIINEPYGNSFAVAEMTLHFILSGTETTLLAPGPTKFNPDVFEVTSQYRPADNSGIQQVQASVDRSLGRWLGATGGAITLSGPGTSMMEASIASLTLPGARGLVISHGKFGDRFADIANARGRACELLRVPEPEWGRAIAPEHVERALGEDLARHDRGAARFAFLCFQQNETSSGVTFHEDAIQHVVRAARTYNPAIVVIVDAISGALAHRLDFDALDVDVLLLGSQKALGVSSGLAFAAVSARARDLMLERAGWHGSFDALCSDPRCERYLSELDRSQRVHSTSLLRLLVAQRKNLLVDEPSVFHLLSTARALELLDAEGGVDAVVHRHRRLAQLARDGIQRLGLRLMAAAPFASDSVTVALVPGDAGISASRIRKAMARETGIEIAGAQGDYWKPQMIRIGTLGFVSHADVVRCLRALEAALAEGRRGVDAGHTDIHVRSSGVVQA